MIEKKISWDMVLEGIKFRYGLKEVRLMTAQNNEPDCNICETPDYIIGEVQDGDQE